jgi:glucose/arabinose dehydrogenase
VTANGFLPLALAALVAAASGGCGAARSVPAPKTLEGLSLPAGFSVAYWARGVDGARSLAVSETGTVFVGSRGPGNVYALRDTDGDGVADARWTVLDGLDSPNGVALRDGDLYVAEISRVLRIADVEQKLDEPGKPNVVTDGYPTDGHHGWKFIRFGPDGRLYVPVGAPCNVCLEPDPYASITRLDVATGKFEVFARGVRNTVGFDWHPRTGELWFTENGRDWMGNDSPPDELNRAPKAGLHFGFPYRHGRDVDDPEFADRRAGKEIVAPELELGAHVAALGMRFYRGGMFPAEYRGRIIYAEHGSWNRDTPTGYRVAMVRFEDGKPAEEAEPFVAGWLRGGTAWGRPVDVAELPDGSLLISDDRADAIYRVTYERP